jgi:hypothetical protein
MKQMLKTRTGLFYWPADAPTPDPNGEIHYLYTETEHEEVRAALAAAEKLLDQLAARYKTREFTFTHVMGQKAEEILTKMRRSSG